MLNGCGVSVHGQFAVGLLDPAEKDFEGPACASAALRGNGGRPRRTSGKPTELPRWGSNDKHCVAIDAQAPGQTRSTLIVVNAHRRVYNGRSYERPVCTSPGVGEQW